jgi:Predicted transmembrane transcriptional regulator (anti-sigma factor)
MSCPSFELLSAEADGALSDSETRGLRSHVSDCEHCQALLSEIHLLKNEVRRVASTNQGDRADRDGLAEAVRRRRSRRSARRRWLGLAGASAAALIAVAVGFPVIRQRQALAEMIGDHVDITVRREEAFDIVGNDPQELARSFVGRINFALRIPRLSEGRLVGARLCNIQGRGIPLASYELHGRRVSVFIAAGRAPERETQCEEGVKGYTVCQRSVRGVEYLLVSDYPAPEARNILGGALASLNP